MIENTLIDALAAICAKEIAEFGQNENDQIIKFAKSVITNLRRKGHKLWARKSAI